MDTNRLKYFCTIAETGSMTKAAEILAVSHSGLSKAISALEDETKLQLFRPLGRGLEITSEGRWFYQKAQAILQIENEISLGVKQDRKAVRMGLPEVIAVSCSGLLASEFAEPLTLTDCDIGELEAKMLAGEIDFGLSFAPSLKLELEYLELGEVRFNSFARSDLLKKHPADQIPFAFPSMLMPVNPMGYKVRDGWPLDVPRRTYFAVSGFSIALDLLRSGEAAVYMPNFVASLENEKLTEKMRVTKIPEHRSAETRRKLFLVKPKTVDESKDMKKAAKLIRRTCLSER